MDIRPTYSMQHFLKNLTRYAVEKECRYVPTIDLPGLLTSAAT